jgi:hypothetical protein
MIFERELCTASQQNALADVHSDQPQPLALLRVRSERPKTSRTSNDFDEIASSHCLPQGSGPRQLSH